MKKKFFLIYGVKIIIIFDFKIDGLNGRIEMIEERVINLVDKSLEII